MLRTTFIFICSLLATAVFAQAIPARPVVINEILFDPKPGGGDYIEIYNRSDSAIDISTLALTNRNSSGQYGVLKKLSDTTRHLLPNAYVVFIEDAADLALRYFVKTPDAVIEVASLPSYPNAEGTVVLADTTKTVIDEVRYNEDWHFELLADAEGVALERINPDGRSNDKNNWRSASSDAGYGTPGYQNSQYKLFQNPISGVTVTPKIFSPDGDGTDDAATIEYTVSENGTVANVFIYDVSGRQVRHLVKNGVLGNTGKFVWDGLDERGQRLPIGQYIVYTELFNLQGRKKLYKNAIVLTWRLN
jgi:hypothetical protein